MCVLVYRGFDASPDDLLSWACHNSADCLFQIECNALLFWEAVVRRLFLLLIVALGVFVLSQVLSPPFEQPPISQIPERAPRTAEEVAKPHLDRAEKRTAEAIEHQLQALSTFFDEPRKNAREFAQKALGWGSKWRFIVDKLPFTRGDRHEEYIRDAFEAYFFKSAQLEEEVRRVLRQYLETVRIIEGKMLLELRADAPDLPSSYLMAELDQQKVHAVFQEALSRALGAAGAGLRTDVTSEVVSLVAGQVLAQVGVRFGLTTAIMGTGAASGWSTAGFGLVVGFAVDQIVSGVWNLVADPEGRLAAELEKKLTEINAIIVDGSGESQGLRARLQEFARERAIGRKKAVIYLLEPVAPTQ